MIDSVFFILIQKFLFLKKREVCKSHPTKNSAYANNQYVKKSNQKLQQSPVNSSSLSSISKSNNSLLIISHQTTTTINNIMPNNASYTV